MTCAQLYVTFWGARWQTPAGRARAAAIADWLKALPRESGTFFQASFYFDDRWDEGACAFGQTEVEVIVQELIDRGGLPDGAAPGDAFRKILIVVFDEQLPCAASPDIAAWETRLGKSLPYLALRADVAGGLESVVEAALVAGADDRAVRGSGAAQAEATGDLGRLLPLPSFVMEARRPRFRIEKGEIASYLRRLAHPMRPEDVHGAAVILGAALAEIETRKAEQARSRSPATPAELADFSVPNPRLTIDERFAAMSHALGDAHPDILTVKEILAGVRDADLAQLRDLYLADHVGQGPFKFADVVFWTHHKLRLARTLCLKGAPPLSIWDIGCGGGHFARVCQFLGHRVLATDKENPIYRDIAQAMRVERLIDAITPLAPTRDFARRFDLIVAFAIEFNHLQSQTRDHPRFWGLDHWRFLFNDLIARQLAFPGRIYLGLNCEMRDGVVGHNLELMELCERHGARADRRSGLIDWPLAGPIEI